MDHSKGESSCLVLGYVGSRWQQDEQWDVVNKGKMKRRREYTRLLSLFKEGK
jgi:hypothetical protein